MTDKKHMKSRDFGGADKEDWFLLYEDIDPKRGLTPKEYIALAKALSAVGYTVKKDPLGGGDRKGVYYRKSEKKTIDFYTIPPSMLTDWYQKHIGTTKHEPVSESSVSNFIAQNPRLICGDECEEMYVWREQELGDSKKKVDVIIETKNQIWIVEVKFTKKFNGALVPLVSSARQVRKYREEIQKLRWWKDKELRLCIVWGVLDEPPDLYSTLYRNHQFHSDSY